MNPSTSSASDVYGRGKTNSSESIGPLSKSKKYPFQDKFRSQLREEDILEVSDLSCLVETQRAKVDSLRRNILSSTRGYHVEQTIASKPTLPIPEMAPPFTPQEKPGTVKEGLTTLLGDPALPSKTPRTATVLAEKTKREIQAYFEKRPSKTAPTQVSHRNFDSLTSKVEQILPENSSGHRSQFKET